MTKTGTHWFLFLLGIGLSAWMVHTLSLHYDHRQMLEKAFLLLDHGQWTHFGSRGTGVGFVPGTFLTALYGLPMFLWRSPYAPAAVLVLFHAIGFALFYFPTRRIFGPLTATFLLLFFWLSPWRLEQTELYNPGYLFLFSGLHFWTSYQLRSEAKFWPTVLHVVALGLCAQVHFSALILGFASVLLWIFRLAKPNLKGVAVGLLLVALTFAPYILSLDGRPESGIQMHSEEGFFLGRNFLYVYPVLKALLYWLRYGSAYFARHIFSEINFLWVQSETLRAILSATFHVLKFPLALATLYVSFKAHKDWLKKAWPSAIFPLKRVPPANDKDWVFKYAFYLLVGMILAAGLSPVEFNHWHLILCFPTAALLVSAWITHAPKWNLKPIFWTLLIYFSVYNVLAGMGSRTHALKNNYHDEVLKEFPAPTQAP